MTAHEEMLFAIALVFVAVCFFVGRVLVGQ